ncbi:hypothetical protein D3C71_1739880 [compost metagenome]
MLLLLQRFSARRMCSLAEVPVAGQQGPQIGIEPSPFKLLEVLARRADNVRQTLFCLLRQLHQLQHARALQALAMYQPCQVGRQLELAYGLELRCAVGAAWRRRGGRIACGALGGRDGRWFAGMGAVGQQQRIQQLGRGNQGRA